MGSVDLQDNAVANYRINICGKKWWWPLFINMLDSTVVNASNRTDLHSLHRGNPFRSWISDLNLHKASVVITNVKHNLFEAVVPGRIHHLVYV